MALAAYATLAGLLLCVGYADACLCAVLGLSRHTACFVHGAALALYVCENWSLWTALQAREQPAFAVIRQQIVLQKLVRENEQAYRALAEENEGLRTRLRRLRSGSSNSLPRVRSWHPGDAVSPRVRSPPVAARVDDWCI